MTEQEQQADVRPAEMAEQQTPPAAPMRLPAEVAASLPNGTTFSIHTGDKPPLFFTKYDQFYFHHNDTLVAITELPLEGRVEVWVSVWSSDKSGRRAIIPMSLAEIEARTFARAAELAEAMGASPELVTMIQKQAQG